MVAATPKPLTAGQVKVLDYLHRRQAEGLLPPTTREIQIALGMGSQTSVIQFLRALESKGFIRTLPGKARGVLPVQPAPKQSTDSRHKPSPFIDVPVYGHLMSAGNQSLDYLPPPDTLPVHAASMRLTNRSRPFALRVETDEMIGACIKVGDYVVCDAACEPRPGDVVAARRHARTHLRRYVVQHGMTSLSTENPRYGKMEAVRDFHIEGVMVGLVRGANVF